MSSLDNISFSSEELIRYQRHFSIPEFGFENQKKLKQSKVLVVGAGGLGTPLLLYLAAAGVGTLGIVDHDTVDATNLQRQVLYEDRDIGKLKTEVIKKRLEIQNPHVDILTYPTKLTSHNVLNIFKNYDIISDGTDNFPTRYLINDACTLLNKPNVYASIFQFEGELSIFNYTAKNGIKGPNYRCLYPSPPPLDLIPNCAQAGVLGVLAGIMGGLQANEVIKIITGMGDPLSGKLLTFNALTCDFKILTIKDESSAIHSLEPFTVTTEPSCNAFIKEIASQDFLHKKNHEENFQLIDVREADEYQKSNLGGILIPLSVLEQHIDKISKTRPVIIHCQSGARSIRAIQLLQNKFGFTNLWNLKGGLDSFIL